MPASYSWILATPSVAAPGAFPPFGTGGGAAAVCDGVFHDQGYFLALLDRVLDPAYLDPIKVTPNGGYEVLQAHARVGERVSRAIERLECGSFIIYAQGPAYATGTVEFYRASGAAGAVTMQAGTVVTTSAGARDFVTTTDAVFTGTGDLGPRAATVVAVAPGYEWNLPGQRVTAGGEVLPGEIDTIKGMVQAPAFGDPTIQVRQVLDTDGGRPPLLDGLGADRGLPRNPGEGDEAYRFRLRQLPDVVSPDAVLRNVHGLLDPLNAHFDFIETWDVRYQTCWDAPSRNAGTPTYQATAPASPKFDDATFVYDDPRPAYDPARAVPFFNRWLDDVEFRGAFIITVPPFPAVADARLAYDDTAAEPAAFVTANGRRAYTAYDVPMAFDATLGLQGGYDGFDLGARAVYLGVWQNLQKIKAGGVAAVLELQGQ